MRKLVASVVFACVLCVSFSANAETRRRFRRETLYHLVAAPAYLLIDINIHEGLGHGLAIGLVPETELVSYRPYPHFIRNEDGSRHFVWGSIYYQWDRCNPPSNAARAYISISPFIADISIFIATDLMLSLGVVSSGSLLGGMMFMVGMVGTSVDLFVNLLGSMTPGRDMYKAAMFLGIHPGVFTVIGSMLAAAALVRIIFVGIDVFTEPVTVSPRQRCRRSVCRRRVNVTVSPFVGENSGGIAVGGTM